MEFREIDLFDFTCFFGLDFLKLSGPLWSLKKSCLKKVKPNAIVFSTDVYITRTFRVQRKRPKKLLRSGEFEKIL